MEPMFTFFTENIGEIRINRSLAIALFFPFFRFGIDLSFFPVKNSSTEMYIVPSILQVLILRTLNDKAFSHDRLNEYIVRLPRGEDFSHREMFFPLVQFVWQLALPQQPLHLDNGSNFLRRDPNNGIDPSHIGHCLSGLVQMHILPYLVDVLLVLDLREVLDAFVMFGLLAE